jgi:hypothetical protein
MVTQQHGETLIMAGWGSYQPRKKSPAELALERRRELAKKFPSDIDELIALAAKCAKKPKRLPYVPPVDAVNSAENSAEIVVGPCQLHVANMKAWRAGIAPVIVEEAPYVDERTKKPLGRPRKKRAMKSC